MWQGCGWFIPTQLKFGGLWCWSFSDHFNFNEIYKLKGVQFVFTLIVNGCCNRWERIIAYEHTFHLSNTKSFELVYSPIVVLILVHVTMEFVWLKSLDMNQPQTYRIGGGVMFLCWMGKGKFICDNFLSAPQIGRGLEKLMMSNEGWHEWETLRPRA